MKGTHLGNRDNRNIHRDRRIRGDGRDNGARAQRGNTNMEGNTGMAAYAWKVDWHQTPLFEDERLPVYGPCGMSEKQQKALDHPKTPELCPKGKAVLRFRLMDDDGEHYYSGWFLGDPELDEDAFGPLDDWGTPNAGATEIQYKNKAGEWEAL